MDDSWIDILESNETKDKEVCFFPPYEASLLHVASDCPMRLWCRFLPTLALPGTRAHGTTKRTQGGETKAGWFGCLHQLNSSLTTADVLSH